MNFVDKQNVTGVQVGEKRCQITGFFDGRTGGDADVDTHFVGDDACQCSLTQAGRAIQQGVIQRLVSATGSRDIDGEVLKSKPMPFCILDEIEAALDDANVDRFASYLKRFSEDTQFIVITHRKPTMNQADVLFGVTMQEKGVSKIVSVKLSEVETKLGAGTVE